MTPSHLQLLENFRNANDVERRVAKAVLNGTGEAPAHPNDSGRQPHLLWKDLRTSPRSSLSRTH